MDSLSITTRFFVTFSPDEGTIALQSEEMKNSIVCSADVAAQVTKTEESTNDKRQKAEANSS